MRLFVKVDLLEVLVEWIRKASSDKLGLGIVGETLLVEFTLEVLQGQGIVEDCADDRVSQQWVVQWGEEREMNILMPSLTIGVMTRFSIGEA